jgi:starvation-inducible DNA-binding protein
MNPNWLATKSIIIFLRENINRFADDFKDAGTSDFITSLMEEHEKLAWMPRSHLA